MTPAELAALLAGPPRRIHLLGVAGSGMSGIAALLMALGHRVSGSDRSTTVETGRLTRLGLVLTVPHDAACVAGAELVVRSSAVRAGNPAYDEAVRLGLPMVRRADALSAIMAGKRGILVCGMHGKTTTSAMAAHVLRHAGLKPSHYVGAEIPILGANARWDAEGEWFVAEGDESDGTLINYKPEHALVLNIEPEHLDFYRDLSAIDAVFSRLCAQTSGAVIYCADDDGCRRVCASHPGALGYGTTRDALIRMENLRLEAGGSSFQVIAAGETLGELRLGIPGAHNARNALAVAALAWKLGVPFERAAEALASFRGARRRFETLYQGDVVIVDDYGHHPSEIRCVIETARQTGARRVHVLFQPHRYSRTAAFREEFAEALASADSLCVTEVYPAGEQPLPGVSGLGIVEEARKRGLTGAEFEAELGRMHTRVGNRLAPGDLVLSLGAGNIHEAAARLRADLELRDRLASVMGPGIIRLYEPLNRHTTLRVGGPAQFWAEPETEGGFAELVKFCHDEGIPFFVMGRGSNLLVRDGGIPGVVARLARGDFLKIEVRGSEIAAGVGVRLKRLAAAARAAGLGGFEWMDGIPGNLGGALRMNAGAMGTQTFDQVVRVRMCDADGNILSRTPAELEVHYRSVPSLCHCYALSAVLAGTPAPDAEIAARLAESEHKRRSSQPAAASAGCIFKNPGTVPAGRLIEELGFKNFKIGGARVSDIHANFIVNDGGATARDVLGLMEEIRAAALRERGIALEPEVQIVGEDA
ncbi:MAG: UDP-N-acetylmuramate--L-alanine ligase [Terrimicrobiaceae bacterium]|nr:UDP-N-acetylmuramate--L-alanine ligase [Terrimicrobiaceae bacterium]